MDMKYAKTKLDENVVKFTINDNCQIVGDKENIDALFGYFDTLNAEIESLSKIDMTALSNLQQTLQALNDVVNKDQVGVERKIRTQYSKYYQGVRSGNASLDDFILGNMVKDPLYFLTAEELLCFIQGYATKAEFDSFRDFLPPRKMWRSKTKGIWFEKTFRDFKGHVALKYSTPKNKFIPEKEIHCIPHIIGYRMSHAIDPELIQSRVIRVKNKIDTNGGLSLLYRAAKRDYKGIEVCKSLGIESHNFAQYFKLYGFSGWIQWKELVNNFSSWKKCKEFLIYRLNEVCY